MPAEPYTPAELETAVAAAEAALPQLVGWPDPTWMQAALAAFLPDHDARLAERIARMLVDHAAREPDGSVDQVVMLHAAELVRAHATTPTTGGGEAE